MKNFLKLAGIIVIVVAAGFFFASCDEDKGCPGILLCQIKIDSEGMITSHVFCTNTSCNVRVIGNLSQEVRKLNYGGETIYCNC
jgi:hypothetical protein